MRDEFPHKDSYASAWRATASDDVAAREKLFFAINIVGKVRDHLAAIPAANWRRPN